MWRAALQLTMANTATASLALRRVAAPAAHRAPPLRVSPALRTPTRSAGSTNRASPGAGGSGGGAAQQGPFSSYFGAYRTFRATRHWRQDVQYQTFSMYLERLPPVFRELLLYSPMLALLYFVLVSARVYYLDEGEPWYHLFLLSRWRYGAAGSSNAHVSTLLQHAPPPTKPDIVGSLTKVTISIDMGPTAAGTLTVGKDASGDCEVGLQRNTSNAAANTQEPDVKSTITTVTTYRYAAADVHDTATAAAAAGADGLAPPLVAPFHCASVLRVIEEHEMDASTPATKDGAARKATAKAEEAELIAAAKAVAEAHPHGVWGGPLQVLRDPATNSVMGYSTTSSA